LKNYSVSINKHIASPAFGVGDPSQDLEASVGKTESQVFCFYERAGMAVCQVNDVDAAAAPVWFFHERILEIADLYLHARGTAKKMIFTAGIRLGKQLGHPVFTVDGTLGKAFLYVPVQGLAG